MQEAAPKSKKIVPTPQLSQDELFERYIKFIAIPLEARQASRFNVITKDEFCIKYGITIANLAVFEDKPEFQEKYRLARIEWARSKTPELLGILYKKYQKDQNSQDLKLWLELTGEIKRDTPQTPVGSTTNILNVFNISDDQKKQILERASRKFNSQ